MHRFLPLFALLLTLLAILPFSGKIDAVMKSRQLASSPAVGELSSQSYVERVLLSDGQLDPNATAGVWFNHPVKTLPKDQLASILNSPPNVLGQNNGEKWIEVDLSNQTLYAHEGDRTVYTFRVSSGLPWLPTVTGEFHIWAKLLSQRMTGGSQNDGTYYDLPNVPFVQYFYKGYGLHGTYWHHDFGHPRSHGCVNLSIDDAKVLFYWTNPQLPEGQSALYNIAADQGTRVVVHGTTPTNLY